MARNGLLAPRRRARRHSLWALSGVAIVLATTACDPSDIKVQLVNGCDTTLVAVAAEDTSAPGTGEWARTLLADYGVDIQPGESHTWWLMSGAPGVSIVASSGTSIIYSSFVSSDSPGDSRSVELSGDTCSDSLGE